MAISRRFTALNSVWTSGGIGHIKRGINITCANRLCRKLFMPMYNRNRSSFALEKYATLMYLMYFSRWVRGLVVAN